MLTSTKRELILEQLGNMADNSFILHYYDDVSDELLFTSVAYFDSVEWDNERLYINED